MSTNVTIPSRNRDLSNAATNEIVRSNRSLQKQCASRQNVGKSERIASASAGAVLLLEALRRRDLTGFVMAGFGAALAYRGATGHCSMYDALDINTTSNRGSDLAFTQARGTRVVQSFLINKSPEELYAFWRNFENLPRIMSHLESVRLLSDGRSHWTAKAPSIVGGHVEWDAEITADEPNSRISWRALPGGDVEHRGSIQFLPAPGDRGTNVRIDLEYQPPAGQIGRWVAKMFGEEPEQQIRDDLRNFKRMMEVGEVLTIDGQPHGTCTGKGKRS